MTCWCLSSQNVCSVECQLQDNPAGRNAQLTPSSSTSRAGTFSPARIFKRRFWMKWVFNPVISPSHWVRCFVKNLNQVPSLRNAIYCLLSPGRRAILRFNSGIFYAQSNIIPGQQQGTGGLDLTFRLISFKDYSKL